LKITIIAPFPSMQAMARDVVVERSDEWPGSIDIVLGDLNNGIQQARQALAKGTEAIISRGGTAALIAANFDIPVIEIEVTAFDILRALKQIGNYSGTVGIVGFRNVIYGCEDFGELWGVALREITLEKGSDASEKIAQAARDGIRIIIGDVISVRSAIKLGLEGYLIESGKAAIYKAIKEAQRIAQVRRKEQERVELLKTIINSSTDGIVAIDDKARITIFNPMAEKIFQSRAAEVIGCLVKDVIPNTRLPVVVSEGSPEFGELQHIGKKIIATKQIPIKIKGKVVGAIASFQDITQLQRFEQIVRQKLYAKGLVAKITLDQIIGCSQAIKAVKEQASQYAKADSTVLVTGESGTGKEMFAQSIHNMSKRNKGPFVAVNCAAVPENLLESELFGYEDGAFTGAKKGGKPGLFELAHGGTIFLDEIGEMPLSLQARLLRVLQEKEVMRIGGNRIIPIDVRIVAATNQDLDTLVLHNKFRSDLYFRLDILRLHIPPLRERMDDIPVLARYFLTKFSSLNPLVSDISLTALQILKSCRWNGNVRELANIMERTVLLTQKKVIDELDILNVLPKYEKTQENTNTNIPVDLLSEVELKTILHVLQEERFNYTKAAVRLGINRTTLWRKLRNIKST